MEGINGRLGLQTGGLEATRDRAALTCFQLHIGKPFECGRRAHVPSGGFSNRLLCLVTHRMQAQLLQFLFESGHGLPFRIQE